MNRLLASGVLLAACASQSVTAAQISVDASCDIDSDYDLTIDERSVILTRESGVPKAIVMRQGRLFLDDRWVELSAADTQRIAGFEAGAREAMPEAQAIGRDAADIAFTVLGEVAAGFSSDPRAVQEKLDRARTQIDARLARSVTATRFNGRELGDGIGEAVSEVIPSMIGDIVSGAIGAAFEGDASRLKRLDNLDAQIEARVQPRARALEQRAQSLCRRMVELDRIDAALQFRLPDGRPLELLQVRPSDDDTPTGRPGQDAAAEAARAGSQAETTH
jgi:outer membrane lipoprotein SlyB